LAGYGCSITIFLGEAVAVAFAVREVVWAGPPSSLPTARPLNVDMSPKPWSKPVSKFAGYSSFAFLSSRRFYLSLAAYLVAESFFANTFDFCSLPYVWSISAILCLYVPLMNNLICSSASSCPMAALRSLYVVSLSFLSNAMAFFRPS